jgi:3-phenylpropionate/trans-cinnamate dioxygenase ferredoxin reductase subunit
MPTEQIVVVGASLAGLRAAEAIRAAGYVGAIVLLGAEQHPPYDRPPLSKQYLAGEVSAAALQLRPPSELAELGIDLVLGRRAIALDRSARALDLDDGRTLGFDGLVLATGASPRQLSADVCVPSLEGVCYLRTLEQATALRDAAAVPNRRVVVVGGGIIGAEVAASLRGAGAEVTIVEPLAQLCLRVAGPVIGDMLARLHRDHGVAVELGVGVVRIDGERPGSPVEHRAGEPVPELRARPTPLASPTRVGRVVLSDGRQLAADVVVVGIGAEPETAWMAGSGLALDGGLRCDATLLAAPRIVGAGDVARFAHRLFGEELRLEHWTNAAEQGTYAGRRLLSSLAGDGSLGALGLDREASLGRAVAAPTERTAVTSPAPFVEVPYVWSDQYDIKLQVVGVPRADDRVVVVDGSLEDRRFVAIYERDGLIVGAAAVGRARALMAYRRLVAARASFADALQARAG